MSRRASLFCTSVTICVRILSLSAAEMTPMDDTMSSIAVHRRLGSLWSMRMMAADSSTGQSGATSRTGVGIVLQC